MADQAAAKASSIFGAAAADPKKKEPKAKRVMLTNMDTVAMQSLNPYGVSVIDEQPLAKVCRAAQKGNKWAKFHAEIFSEDIERQGIYWSRFCETHVAIIKELKSREDLRACIKETVLTKAMAEANNLLPHFERLNTGKLAMKDKDDDTFGGLKRRKTGSNPGASAAPPSGGEIEESAEAIRAYLARGAGSNFRMLVNFLSAGGMFFAGQAMDLTARGWFEETTPNRDTIANALKARMRQGDSASTAGPSKRQERATGGLFEE